MARANPLKIADVYIHKSVGAKARNYDILDPRTGEHFKFSEGTQMQNSEIFAGRGTKHPLNEAVRNGLSEQYGGRPFNWQHCKGFGTIDFYGEDRRTEVHWFQEPTVGKHRFKIKHWLDE